MRIEIEEQLSDNLDNLLHYLKQRIDSGNNISNVIFDYDTIHGNKVVCSLTYTYPNGNKYHQHFSISINDNNEFILDATDTFSPYNTRYHTLFSTKEDVYNYIRDVEEWDD